MNPIILIGSCKKDIASGAIQALRDTWLKDCAIPYRIFFGRTVTELQNNEVRLHSPDGLWIDLTFKTREMLRWAKQHGYGPVFRCDVDTFVHTQRLAAINFNGDYLGSTLDLPRPPEVAGVDFDFCHGGSGIWLSARAIGALVDAPIDKSEPDKLQDQWIGKNLLAAGIKPVHDRRFSMGKSYGRQEPGVTAANDVITCHLSEMTGVYDPKRMYEAYGRSRKVLIACSTCWRDAANGSNAAIRETWGRSLPAGWDLRFFLGGIHPDERFETPMHSPGPDSFGAMDPTNVLKRVKLFTSPLQGDEVVLDCPDSYFGLVYKTRESLKWALERGYEWIFRIFADTYVFPDRLADSNFFLHEFSGRMFECPPSPAHPNQGHLSPHGGLGYWLSKRAAKAVLYYTEAELEKIDAEKKRSGERAYAEICEEQISYSSAREGEKNQGASGIH